MLRVFQCTRVKKTPGPDGISGQVLCHSDVWYLPIHLPGVSLSLQKIPTLWKTSTVIPVPKKPRPASPNDFHPVALTSHVMKCFKKIVKTMIMNRTVHLLDPLQCAYGPGRGVEGAVATLLNLVHCHVFNTLHPHLRLKKIISEFKVEFDLALWVLKFLVGKSQQVRVNNTMFSVKVVSTGTPQGCVLSPLLYILYTNDCRSTHPNRFLNKDDSS